MKKNLLYLLALSAMVAGGCSKSEVDVGSINSSNAISFETSSDKLTKAPTLDNSNVTNYKFGVFAYYTGQDKWETYASSSVPAPNFMNDQEVSYSGGVWSYSPVKYWPNTSGDKISFFAYMPKKDDTAEMIKGTNTLPAIEFTQTMDDEDMVDFTVAQTLDQTKSTSSVILPFKHILTRLNFAAKVDQDLAADKATKTTRVFVTGLRVLGTANSDGVTSGSNQNASGENTASKLFDKAVYQLKSDGTNGEWIYDNSTHTSAAVANAVELDKILNLTTPTLGATAYNTESVEVSQSGAVTPLLIPTNTTTPTVAQYLFLIPPYGKDGVKAETDIRVQVDYDIVTLDSGITEPTHVGYSITSTSATLSLPNGSLKESKAYNIVITFGLESVRLAANAADWESETIVDGSSVDAASADAAGIVAAMETLNGYKAVNNNTNYFTINIAGAASGDYDLSTADALYNFEEADQIKLAFESGTVGTVTTPDGWEYDATTTTLKKTSKQGWYVSDLTGARGLAVVHILDETLTSTQLATLGTELTGSTITRSATTTAATELTLYMDNLTAVAYKGFSDYSNLVALHLPKVAKLGNKSFANCAELTTLSIATAEGVTLKTSDIGINLFGTSGGSTKTDIANITLTVGNGVDGINPSTGEWKVDGTTYNFDDDKIVVENQKENVNTSGTIGQQGMTDGGNININ